MVDTNDTKDTNDTNTIEDLRIREEVQLEKVALIYKHFEVEFTEGFLSTREKYSLAEIMFGAGNPPILVYFPEGYEFNPRKTGYVLQSLDEKDLAYLGENPPDMYLTEKLRDITKTYVRYSNFDVKAINAMRTSQLWHELLGLAERHEVHAFLKVGDQISDQEIQKVCGWDWSRFLDRLLYMEAEKDERIVLVAKANMIPHFPEMSKKNSISLVITNSGTSKSVTFSRFGEIVTRTTTKSITGGAQTNGRVVQSFLMGHKYPYIIEHLEAKPEEGLLSYLITAISGLPGKIVVWQTEREFKPYCGLIVNGNPSREKEQPSFEVFFIYLQGISTNYVALGRRIGIVAYGMDYKTVQVKKDMDLIPWLGKAWTVWREVARRIEPLVRQIYSHRDVSAWIHKADEEYGRDVAGAVLEVESAPVKDFFMEHGRNAYPAIKWRALSCSLVDHAQRLLGVGLGEESLEDQLISEILSAAKSYYDQIKTLNYESIKQIAETGRLDEKIMGLVFAHLPRYLREFLVTVAHHVISTAETEATLEELSGTFDDIKGEVEIDEKSLYSGFSIITQSINRHRPHIKHGTRLSTLGVRLRQKAGVWIVTVNPAVLRKFVSVLSALSALSVRYAGELPAKVFYKLPPGEAEERGT